MVQRQTTIPTPVPPQKIPIAWILVGALAVGLLIFATGLFIGGKSGSDSDPMADIIAGKAKAGTLTSRDLEVMVPGGLSQYEKLTGEKVVAPNIPSVDGSWTTVISDDRVGTVSIKYTETPSSKGKIAVKLWRDGENEFLIQNITSTPISIEWFVQNKDASGKILDEIDKDKESLKVGGEIWIPIHLSRAEPLVRTKLVELSVEIVP